MGSWRPSSSMMDTVTVEDWIGSPSSLISISTRLVLTSPVYRLTVKREASVASASLSEMGSWRLSSSMMDTVTVEDWIGSPSSLISIRTRLVLTSPVYRLTVKREIQALWPESASTAVTLVTR
uniref:Uncharacterized protein n=1 Tax=Maylandia zebra TaxID=106582 RepID=A0A3P9AY74_9CICH